MSPRSLLKFLAMVAAAFASSASQAQSTGLDDMVGARAGQAEGELQRRGYRNMRGEKGDDRSYSYWWNEDSRQCVSIATMDGRYASVTPSTPPDCGKEAARTGRVSNKRDHRDRGSRAFVAPDELSRICRNEASARFDRRPSEVTANAPIQQRDGYLIQGWYDRRDDSKGTTFFNCRFDPDGRFLSVN